MSISEENILSFTVKSVNYLEISAATTSNRMSLNLGNSFLAQNWLPLAPVAALATNFTFRALGKMQFVGYAD